MLDITAHTDTSRLELVIQNLDDSQLTEKMIEVAKVAFENPTKSCFEQEREPTGAPWASLAPSTVRKKRREGKYPSQILTDTGKLKGSFTAQGRGKGIMWYGTNVEYAPYHEYGTKKMPARPFLPTSQANLDNFIAELNDALFGSVE